jgi:Helix-turn-helix of DDE superfamily endonuclease
MVLAHLRKGETYRDLAAGFGVGVTTAYWYLREGLDVAAALAPTLEQAIAVAARKAYVILDETWCGSTGSRWPRAGTGRTTAASTRPTA